MNLSREKAICLAIFIIGLVLIIGTEEQRIYKANLISGTIYYPLVSNVRYIETLLDVHERNKILSETLAEYKIKSNRLENELFSLKSIVKTEDRDPVLDDQKLDFTLCAVIAYQGSFSNRNLIINKGHLDGIRRSHPVISENGVVGKILNVFPKHSLVMPITNPQFRLGVITKNSRVQGLLEADVSGNVYMTMIPSGTNIAVGDTVMTSSVSTVFPRGYGVGTVRRVFKTPEDVFLRASIEPFNQINNLEQVIVLFYKKDLPEL